jgi:hypothetical protein
MFVRFCTCLSICVCVCVSVCKCVCSRISQLLTPLRGHHPRMMTFAIAHAESNGAAMPSPGTRTTLRNLLWVSVSSHPLALQLSLSTSPLSALFECIPPHLNTPMRCTERSERSPLAPCTFVWDANQQGQNGDFLIMLEFTFVLRNILTAPHTISLAIPAAIQPKRI